MEDYISEAYRLIMDGYSGNTLSEMIPSLKEDGSFVILSATGFYNNGEATVVAQINNQDV